MSDGIKLPPSSGTTQLTVPYPQRINVDVEMAETEVPVSWDSRFTGFVGTHGGLEASTRFSAPLNDRWALTATPYARAQVGDHGFDAEPGIKLGATYDRFDFSVPVGYELTGGGFTTGIELGYDVKGFGGFDPVMRASFNDDGGAFTIGLSRRF